MEVSKYLSSPYGIETKEFREAGGIVLSPSSFSKFHNTPDEWYLDRIGKPTFDANSNTVLGNAVHGAIDAFWNGDTVTEADVKLWVETHYSEQMETVVTNYQGQEVPKVDIEFVLANFMPMFEAWKHEYAELYPKPDITEGHVSLPIQDGMIMAGTLDGYEEERGIVIDYKTCGAKKTTISTGYRLQLVAYAIALKAQGKEVNGIRIVYIQRPTKRLPARVHIVDEELTQQMIEATKYSIGLMRDSWNLVQDNPELAPVVFRPNPVAAW